MGPVSFCFSKLSVYIYTLLSLGQWSSTWAKSAPRGRFTRFGGGFLHWLGVKHYCSHKEYECALCRCFVEPFPMFKVRQMSRETVALSSLLGWITQSFHNNVTKRTSNNICQPVYISTQDFGRFTYSTC